MRKHSKSSISHTLIAWKFNNEADRLSGTLPSTATVTFVEADLGRRAYDIDTMTFWDISDVVAGVPTWVSSGGLTIGEVNSLINIAIDGIPKRVFVQQHEGFNEDVPYIAGTNQIPNFVLHDNGSLIYVELD
jgi:hypothetical protein